MRRIFAFLMAGLLGFAVCATARAERSPCSLVGNNNDFLGIQTIRLWPGDAPEAKGNTCRDIPTLTVFEPAHGAGNGSAVIVFPGGGYSNLDANQEGRQVADWFTAHGFRAFILGYRLATWGYQLPVPLLDARRAVQLVRARARDYSIDPNRIVIIGFSAGGNLVALAATQFIPGKPDSDDPIERVSSRPDYLVLGYPWIGTFSPSPKFSYCDDFDLTVDRCEALRAAYSPELFVTKDTPPTFWYHTLTDEDVPIEQGLRFYNALVKAGVSTEAHIFAHGPHGVGLGQGDAALDQWPNLLENWLRAQGLLTPMKTVKQ